MLLTLLAAIQSGDLNEMRALIKPRPGECRYLELPWVIDPAEAIRRSAQEGRPLVVCGGADGSCATGAQ